MKGPKYCTFCGKELEKDILSKKYDRYTGSEVYGLICPEWNVLQKEIENNYEEISVSDVPNLHDKLFDEL